MSASTDAVLDSSKLRGLGWAPRIPFAEGLAQTVRWYRENEAWWRPLKSGAFRDFYQRNYRPPVETPG